MWPLLACSLAALTVILERIFFWSRLDVARDKAGLEWLLEEYRKGGGKSDPPTGVKQGLAYRMLLSGMAHSEFSCTRAMEAVVMDEVKTMRRGMTVLDTIITVAPMLGILGTVTGIITSFDMLGQMDVMDDPRSVVAGIAEALITTAAGLTISVGAVFPYNYFNSRINSALDTLELYGARLEILQQHRRPARDMAGNA